MAYSQSGLQGRLSYRQTLPGHITQSVVVMAYGNKQRNWDCKLQLKNEAHLWRADLSPRGWAAALKQWTQSLRRVVWIEGNAEPTTGDTDARRSEERSVGQECVSKCSTRWRQYN